MPLHPSTSFESYPKNHNNLRDSARQTRWPGFDPKRYRQWIGHGARPPNPWKSRDKDRVKLEMSEDCLQ